MQVIAPKVATIAFFVMLYKVVPNTYVPFKHALIGAIPAAILFIAASNSYGGFTSRFTNYQAVYGALAAIPLFLLWLYVLWLITLFGAVIAWRAQQGFTFKEEVGEEAKATPLEKYRNHQLQSLTPLLTLTLIYKNFSSANGEGFSAQQICNETHLPTSWILESLEVLESKKYIVRASNSNSDIDDSMLASYFPTVPPAKLNLQSFAKELSAASYDWLSDWEAEQSEELKNLVNKVTQFGEAGLPDKDFDKLILEISHA
jgi:membrane protein